MRRRRDIEAERRRLSALADRAGDRVAALTETNPEVADDALREQQQLMAVIHALGWVLEQQQTVLRPPRKRLKEP